MVMTPDAHLADALRRARCNGPVLRLGVAVSGGGDSMALLHLTHDWAAGQGAQVFAATVDHGLRPEAAAEARVVAEVCRRLECPHQVLTWGDAPAGNVQDAARQARYDLLAGWAKTHGLDAVLLGHTADDQAETFLMRLARGSGVDGLAAMRRDWHDRGIRWLRPVLQATRDDLRGVLRARGVAWVEDPSNDDTGFDRVRMRCAMQDLAGLGLDRARLVSTADRMKDARAALSWLAHDAAQRFGAVRGGDVCFQAEGFATLPDETRHRLLAHAITFVSSTPYRPRYAALCQMENDVMAGQTRSLQGCLISNAKGLITIGRELRAVADLTVRPGQVWDARWRLDAPDRRAETTHVAALADGIRQVKDWRDAGLARATVMAAPALWCGGTVLAAPLVGFGPKDVLKCMPETKDFLTCILSH